MTPDHLRDIAETIDILTDLAAPLLHAAKMGHTKLHDGHGHTYDLTTKKMNPDSVAAITEYLEGTEQQEDLRRWADEMEREWWCAAPDFLECWPRDGELMVKADYERTDDPPLRPHPYPDRHRLCRWQWTLPADAPDGD